MLGVWTGRRKAKHFYLQVTLQDKGELTEALNKDATDKPEDRTKKTFRKEAADGGEDRETLRKVAANTGEEGGNSKERRGTR